MIYFVYKTIDNRPFITFLSSVANNAIEYYLTDEEGFEIDVSGELSYTPSNITGKDLLSLYIWTYKHDKGIN